LVIGLWIIVLGALLLLGNLGVINAGQVWSYIWPLVVVLVGSSMILNQTRARRQRLGWVLVIVGSWFFINRIGWIDISIFRVLLPGLLLFIGGMLVWRAFAAPNAGTILPPKFPGESNTSDPTMDSTAPPHTKLGTLYGEDPQPEFMRSFAVMSSNELRPVSRPFRGADLSAVMAGIRLNLLDARMESDSSEIEVFAFWGGMEIHVPPDWTVVSKVTTLMGGFIDKRRPTTVVPTKTLIISGLVVMSGIEIKN
jgi:predicted membrane protein